VSKLVLLKANSVILLTLSIREQDLIPNHEFGTEVSPTGELKQGSVRYTRGLELIFVKPQEVEYKGFWRQLVAVQKSSSAFV